MSRLNEEQMAYVLESLRILEFGSINITVHNGTVTQIDTTEKRRFPEQLKSRPRAQFSHQLKN